MSFSEKAGNAGGMVLGAMAMLVLFMLPVAFIFGAAEISIWAMEWMPAAFAWTLWITLLLFVPLALLPATRGVSGNGLVIASHVFGLILWLWGMAITYQMWGLFWLVVGLGFFGVGVVPIAMIAVVFEGEWMALGNLSFLLVLTLASRGFGYWLIEKAALRRMLRDYNQAQDEAVIPAERL